MADEEKILFSVEVDVNDANKGIDDLTDSIVDLEKANSSLRTDLKKTDEQLEEEGKTRKQVNKELALNQQELKEERQERNKLIKTLKTNSNSYDALSQKTARLRKQQKALDTSTKEGRKQYNLLEKQIAKNNATLTKADKGVRVFGRNVGNYVSALGKAPAALGAMAVGAVSMGVALKGVRSIIESTQATGDKFDQTIAGMKATYDAFNKSIASGDLKNVFKNMREAFKAGVEYAKILDDLGDRERDLNVTRAEAQVEIEKLTGAVQNVTLADEERIAAAKEIFEIEKGLLSQTQSVRQQEYEAHLGRISDLTGLERDKVLEFVRNYDEESGVREDAIELIETERRLRNALVSDDAIGAAYSQGNRKLAEDFRDSNKAINEQLRELFESTPENVIDYATLYRQYSKTTDDELNKVVDSWIALQDAESGSISGLRRITNQYNTLLKSITDEKEKQTEAAIDFIEEEEMEENAAFEAFDEITKKRIESDEQRAAHHKDINDFTNQVNQELHEKELKRIEEEESAKEKAAQDDAERRMNIARLITDTWIGLSEITGQFIEGEIDSWKDYLKAVVGFLLDQLKATVVAEQARILIQSIASFESIATGGVAGIAKAAGLIALTTAATSAAKAALNRFDEGGELKTGMFTGPSHAGGGVQLSANGVPVAEVEGGERFFVINKKSSALIDQLSSINAIHGKPFSTPVKFAQEGGEVATQGVSVEDVLTIIQNSPIFVSVTDINEEQNRQVRVVANGTI